MLKKPENQETTSQTQRNEILKNVAKSGPFRKNRQVVAITGLFMFLFLGMIGYLSYFTATSKQDMINNSYNSRQEILLSQNYRGSIYSADKRILAESILQENGTEIRRYPYESLFSHVVGYSTKGKTGIEAQANYYLINSNLPLSTKAANDMAGKKNAGNNVYTTLNVRLQEVASEYLQGYEGAVIATDPSTGKIMAMVSKPDYDPNEIVDIWSELVEDKESSVLLNRATQGMYPPGSTFKIITALEYIRQYPDTYMDYSYLCNGSYIQGDYKINCYHGLKHGEVDFYDAFSISCNSSFVDLGVSLDTIRFEGTLNELLFNQELPLQFNYVKSSVILDETQDEWDMMQTVIGQGKVQMTPIHLNMITCAIANHGVLMKPYVVDYVETDDGKRIKTFHGSEYGQFMTEEEAAVLTEMMRAVVENDGTGRRLAGLSYTAAGKTGSAEFNNIKGESHAWFTGFAPVDNPEICVTVIIEGGGSGGDYALPIAKQVFDAYFNED